MSSTYFMENDNRKKFYISFVELDKYNILQCTRFVKNVMYIKNIIAQDSRKQSACVYYVYF